MAAIGVFGAVLGAAVAYVATTRAARKAGAAAWAGHTISLAQVLLDADDPTLRAAGTQLLAASARAVGDAPDTPERIKEVTRSGDLADAVDEVGRLEGAQGEPVEIELAGEDDDGDGPGHPQAG